MKTWFIDSTVKKKVMEIDVRVTVSASTISGALIKGHVFANELRRNDQEIERVDIRGVCISAEAV